MSKLETTELTRHFFEQSEKSKKARLEAEAQQLRLIERLEEEGEADLAQVLWNCRQPLKLTCTGCGNPREVWTGCKKRWCPVCARKLAAEHAAKYEAAVAAMEWPLHVSLTEPNRDSIAPAVFRQMRRAFGKLRHKKLWKNRVTGGVAGMEVTNEGKGWHVHLHAVVDCKWLAWKTPMPQRGEKGRSLNEKILAASDELGLAWARCLGIKSMDPDWCGVIFKVKRCKGDEIVREVLKYACKGNDLIDMKDNPADLIRAMNGTRMITSFGSLFGKKLIPSKSEHKACQCGKCGASQWLPDQVVDGIVRKARKERRR